MSDNYFGTRVLILGRFGLYVITFEIRPKIESRSLINLTLIVQINYFHHKMIKRKVFKAYIGCSVFTR